jgi:phenylacetate-coenzyme A ligase PaaK-like adenylate-forming protein
MLLMSPREKAYLMANWFRVLLVAGYDPFRGKTMSRKSAHSVTGGKDTILQRIGILRRYFLDQYAPETEMIRQVNECQPDFLYMNKTELMRMCMYAAKNDIKVWQPKLFCPTGEKIDDAARSVFFKVLGTNMIDSYGTAEAGACMVKLPGMDAHKIWHDSFVVNIHDDDGNLALEGKLACTPLFKKDLPLINYVVGDKVVSEIRDGERFITGVQGRLNDAFKYETGEVTTFFEIAPIIAHCSDLIQIRFIQEDYHNVTVQAVFNEKESTRTVEEVEADLRAQLEAKFKHPFNITFEWKDNLPPDDNGKLRMIVSKVK